MEYWEFLLQKEGDRSWLPIKSSKIEIQAGRYRVVAHSNRSNSDVEIYVTHHSTGEVPPKRRSQKRSRRTNPEGLMVVIPFTYLKAGLWELRCCGDILSDFLGNSWQQAVQLQVLPKAAEVLPTSKAPCPQENRACSPPLGNEPRSPLEGAAQTDVQSNLSENSHLSFELQDSLGRTQAEETAKATENPPWIGIQSQASECTDEDRSDSSPNLSVGEAQEAREDTISSIPPVSSTPQHDPDITNEPKQVESLSTAEANGAIEPTPTEIEAPPLTPPATEVMEPSGWDIALEEWGSEQEEEWEGTQLNSETNPQVNLSLFEASSVSNPNEVLGSETGSWGVETENFGDQAIPESLPSRSEVISSSHQSLQKAAIPPLPEQIANETPVPQDRELLTKSVDESELSPVTSIDSVVPLKPAASDENLTSMTSNSAEVATPTNPILDESLQMLEQILQQVLEPVMQEFEQPEPTDPQIAVTPEPELPLETATNQPGVILTLDEEALVARRGEPLTISGQVDVLNVEQLDNSTTANPSTLVFQGYLCYELRDPQTSQILLDIQQPLSQQALPLAFSHSLEIPPDCQTRLFLGKATLYGSTSVALVSQPFSVSADLDELLGAILPGTKVMPVAKMLVVANTLAAAQEENETEPSQTTSPSLSQTFVDLVNSPQSRQPLSLQPVSQQSLPPQLYQPSPNHKSSKSLQLPKLPQMRFISTVDSSADVSITDGVEVNLEDHLESWSPSEASIALQQITPSEALSPDTASQELGDTAEDTVLKSGFQDVVPQLKDGTLQDNSVSVMDSSLSGLDTTQVSDSPVSDFELNSLKAIETVENSELIADAQVDTSDGTDVLDAITPAEEFLFSDWETTEWEDTLPAAVQEAQVAIDDSIAVDNAFQALKVQDRFWTRLNSLATDAGLSESLKSESYAWTGLTDEVEDIQQLNPGLVMLDTEDVTQPLNSDIPVTDFDESIWTEETEDFASATDDTTQLQSPLLEEEEVKAQPSLASNTNTKWATQEIVVEDEDLPVPEQLVVRQDISKIVFPKEQLVSQPESKIFSPRKLEVPLPAPTLFVPTKELPAGEPVTVRVKMPPHSDRLCIKLWVQDRQSRCLLDGPRWLVDLIPDGAGKLEAMTQLIVPFGSVDIRFEAIAVDLDSQRESHKVAVDCIVVPPDLPDVSLDEFGE
ncbi:MAG TPA: hypothetical protein V6D14_27230 [Coleofasciculaceae cyanobacterium]|jgi:hypothetical protein